MAFVTIKDKDNVTLGHLQTDAQERLGLHNLLHVQDRKTQNTNGGTFTSGAWRTRDLNTVLTNTITDASLASNQITLPAGKYYVHAFAPVGVVDLHQAKLVNITLAADVLLGTSMYNYRSSGGSICSNVTVVSGAFDLAQQCVLELQHRCSLTAATSGFGNAANLATEIYSDLKIWRIA